MNVLILTNGSYGDYHFCKKEENFDYIICADRGLCHARKLGLIPDLIVGDFDSTDSTDLQYFKEKGIEIETFNSQKDETDTELAISRALQKGARKVTVWGGVGSRLDHSLGNVHLLYKLLKSGVEGKLVNPNNTVYLAKESIQLKGKKGDLVSLIPFGGNAKGVTTHQLAYALEDTTLEIGTSLGISNYLLEEVAEVWIKEGMLLVIMACD